jgi:hypothetical protein
MGEIQPTQRTSSGRVSRGKNVPENRKSGITMKRMTMANCPLSSLMVAA